ncbi:heme-binding-like protein At3g10130, chloroplastic [Vigna radiata var. radiata]|uniref:Heme-binding-like protein At3g10130, chloroplastic n=1 Tax=Vigna radiata var. radiata TaxID=3916 RepID=A0A1S3VC23_VIGRR|nr:heme-binding-like protein At3g10130, chloroplastic [Vigna radiata var. radiata]
MSLRRIIKSSNASITCCSSLYIRSNSIPYHHHPIHSLLSTKSQHTPFQSFSFMGLVFGKISVETPKYEVIKSTSEYEIRKYAPCVVAEVTYDPSQFKENKDGGFMVLANYIGALGKPQNTKPEKIAMTAPVITMDSGGGGEKIAMTAPVVTKDGGGEDGKKNKIVTMQFILPALYGKAEEAPKPTDERVVIREEGERKYGVVKFGGVASEEVVKEKVEKLKVSLETDGFKVVGDYLLARYNPPWTIPMFRTNEVMIPVE